jgi:hypothetical protein
LRLADDWNQTLQGGKMPGISGTYGIAGRGGRKSDGRNGWSVRGAFHLSIPQDNSGGLRPIGTYCYHADMRGQYGIRHSREGGNPARPSILPPKRIASFPRRRESSGVIVALGSRLRGNDA